MLIISGVLSKDEVNAIHIRGPDKFEFASSCFDRAGFDSLGHTLSGRSLPVDVILKVNTFCVGMLVSIS